MNIELMEIIDPIPGAMIRRYHCAICGKAHMESGKVARIWIGYSSQAALSCYLRNHPMGKRQMEIFEEARNEAVTDNTNPIFE